MVNLYHEPNIQKLQFGTAGGRVWLGPSARWEEAISLTHRSLPPPPQYRSRDTTPNQLVQSFAHGYGREEEGERRREGGKKREGGREGGIEGGRERKGRGRGGGGVGRRMEGGTDTARNDGFAGSIKSLSSPAAKRERRHGTGIWRGWHQLCNATSSGGTARVPAQLHLVSAAQSSSGAEPRRCQSQHLQECQAPDVTKWSES